jgi:Leucine-rich repeat (LRR) protein
MKELPKNETQNGQSGKKISIFDMDTYITSDEAKIIHEMELCLNQNLDPWPDEVIQGHITTLHICNVDSVEKGIILLPKSVIDLLTRLPALQALRLTSYTIPLDSTWLGCLPRLQTLGIEECIFPAEFEFPSMLSLERLILFRNQLHSIPKGVEGCKNLRELQLSENWIQRIPATLGNLTQLEKIELEYNRIKEVPPEIGNLHSLRVLYLYNNLLTALPPEIGVCTQLKILSLSSNHLITLPNEIGKLTQLERLGLEQNNLRSLPDSFGQLSQLRDLTLTTNFLKKLPDSFGNLKNLSILKLDNNPLEEFPFEIKNFHQLRYVNLDNTKISFLPAILFSLPALDSIDLFNCRLIDIPVEARELAVKIKNDFKLYCKSFERTIQKVLNKLQKFEPLAIIDQCQAWHAMIPEILAKIRSDSPLTEEEKLFPWLYRYRTLFEDVCLQAKTVTAQMILDQIAGLSRPSPRSKKKEFSLKL